MARNASGSEHDLDALIESVMTAGSVLVQITEGALGQLGPQLNLTDFRTLSLLDQEGSMRLIDISAVLDVTPTTATRLADRLSSLGLVERVRQPGDRREIHLVVAPAGRVLVAQVSRARRQVVTDLLRRAGLSERAASARLLDRINQATEDDEATA